MSRPRGYCPSCHRDLALNQEPTSTDPLYRVPDHVLGVVLDVLGRPRRPQLGDVLTETDCPGGGRIVAPYTLASPK